MARSFNQPIRQGPDGAIRLMTEAQSARSLRQVIAIRMAPGDVANPWHRAEGRPAKGSIYRTPAGQAAYLGYIERQFAELEREGRARLVGRPVVRMTGAGRVRIELTYMDLETGAQGSYETEV